ncbi:MAG: BTAD domain-containing putative transcriptional regulator, partial [Dehalococcoidia bacterium]
AGARAVYDEGLAVAQETGELWMVAELYAGLALVHAFDGDLVRGEELVHHAIALAQRQDSRYLEALYSLTLGAIQARTGRADTAVTTLTTAATTLDGMGARRELPRAHLWLVHACDAARDPVDARAHLEAALAQVESLGSDAILDLYARWNPEPFARAVAQGVATTRLRAVLERVHAPPVIIQTTPIPLLPALSVAGFGPGSLTIDGRGDVAWPWDKCRELFFLLLHGGARRQEQVLAALWPEAPPVKAKASLHTAVYRLRRAVLPPALVIRGGVYRINEELVTSYDVRDFERSLRSAAETSGDEAVDLLAQAVALYTAPFLDGLDAEWCVEERERLERRLLIALENLADAHAAAGRPRDSIAAAERLLARDPLREDMHARIIRAYLRLGDRAAALRRFEQCAETLREELGVEPGPELQALARRITA